MEFDLILFDHENFFVRQLTKMDLLVHFSVDTDEEVLNRRQFMGGVQIIKKTAFTVPFYEKWFACCEQHKATLLNDSPSLRAERKDFIENRHDQAILTLLCLQEDPALKRSNDGEHFKILEQKEVYSRLPDWSDLHDFPFWAKRNKEYAHPSLCSRAIRKIKSLLK